MQVEAGDLIARYRQELTQMTERALVAESAAAALQRDLEALQGHGDAVEAAE